MSWIESTAAQIVADMEAQEGTSAITLTVYEKDADIFCGDESFELLLGANLHSQVLADLASTLTTFGVAVRFVVFDAADYAAWLEENEEKESRESRIRWEEEQTPVDPVEYIGKRRPQSLAVGPKMCPGCNKYFEDASGFYFVNDSDENKAHLCADCMASAVSLQLAKYDYATKAHVSDDVMKLLLELVSRSFGVDGLNLEGLSG